MKKAWFEYYGARQSAMLAARAKTNPEYWLAQSGEYIASRAAAAVPPVSMVANPSAMQHPHDRMLPMTANLGMMRAPPPGVPMMPQMGMGIPGRGMPSM